ncbi:hypothetical protein GGI15_000629 [Coemansia interrupta]|uniref:WD40 repeat-like protein n=1 Tax=Coemansia interrupta TaxID=1126814 RepID=A0A9W8HSR2_9FUNG|nr:hypothetical protein GGI15_000629 [Coemansia interrupta]
MSIPFVAPASYVRPKENRPHRFAYDFGSVDPGMYTPAPERSTPKRAPKRTIAYTIPLPSDSDSDSEGETQNTPDTSNLNYASASVHKPHHAQGHVLGVNALALSFHSPHADSLCHGDTGGVLFSGGRDGVVKAWDLNFPLRRALRESLAEGSARQNDSAVAIDRRGARRGRSPRSALRASRLVHSDWVNDLVVVDGGQTVVSASSDQTVRAWAPSRPDERPLTVGSHLDYVKALAYSRHRQVVISGGLDRKIKLWDIAEGRSASGPITALQEFGDASLSSSVYTLSCNAQGSLVVSGSPENVVRIWDTRSGRQVASLSGHTDHIRAVLLSEDSELVLSGSSDTTVKLWSMRTRRCLSTFAHHSDSVWSLHSSHPRFQTFYSASRDGLVAKTVGAGVFADEWHAGRRMSLTPVPRAASIDDAAHHSPVSGSQGVICVAVAKEPEGVVKLVAADDTYIWTATKGATLNRWLDVSIRKPHVVRDHAGLSDGQSISRVLNGSENTDSDDELKPESLILQSLLEPIQTLGISRPENSINLQHRRNQTVDTSRHHAPVSPSLGTTQPENTQNSDHFSSTNPFHNRSQSAGNRQQMPQLGLLTSILKPPTNGVLQMPGQSSEYLAMSTEPESDAMSIPDSPLPPGALLQSDVVGSPTTSPVGAHDHSSGSYITASSRPNPTSADSANSSDSGVVPVRLKPDESIRGRHGLHRHKVLDNRRLVLAQDTRGRVSLWDIMLCRRVYVFPESEARSKCSSVYPGVFGKDLDAIHMAISREPESVNSWCHVDTRVGALTVHLDESRVWSAEVHVDEVEGVTSDVIQAMGEHERVNIGQWMLKRLFLTYARSRVKRGPITRKEATLLNRWAAQIPAGAVVSARPALLGAQQPQTPQESTERGSQNIPPSMNKSATTSQVPVLPSLNIGDADQSSKDTDSSEPRREIPPSQASQLRSSLNEIGINGSSPVLLSASVDSSSALSPNTKRSSTYTENDADTDTDERATTKSSSSATNGASDDSAHLSRIGSPAPGPPRVMNSPGHHHNPSIDAAPNAIPPSLQQQQQQQQEGVPKRSEDGESANNSGSAGKFMHRLRSMRVRKQKSTQSSQANSNGSGSATSTGNTNSMTVPTLPPSNRTISSPDKVSGPAARPDPPPKTVERDEFAEWAGPRYPTDTERTLALLQAPPAPWEQLYSPVICPRLPLPRNVVIQFYQNHLDASEPFAIYRNTVTAVAVPTQDDISMSAFRVTDDPLLSFELAMPAWLTDFLLFNRLPPSYQEPSKVSFILSPLPSATLPPFPNPNARLVANRMLRARKLAVYVVDKLALPLMLQPAQNYISAVESCIRTYGQQGKVSAELLAATNDSRYVDIFTAAGETLTDPEREALADLVIWREVMQRRKTSGDNAQPETPEYVGRPDLYLDLFCKDKKLLPKHTLATIKAHIWKSSGDVQVHYDWAEFVKKRVATAQGLAVKLQQ